MASGGGNTTFGGRDDPEFGSNRSNGSSVKRSSEIFQLEDPFSETTGRSSRREDEEALVWAAWDRLSSYNRLQTAILRMTGSGSAEQEETFETVDLETLDPKRTESFLDNLFRTSPEADNDELLCEIRSRMEKVDVKLPTVEVRYQNLTLDAKCEIGHRALPNLYNTFFQAVDITLSRINLSLTKTTDLNILHNVSGILKPGRMTLLLGPPGCGKTSLLLALAGQLEDSVKVQGELTYNGHTFDEFVPVRTAAYVAQTDLHLAEFTVRETFDYSAQYQGVGSRFDLLKETIQREKELGIHPDPDVDVYMKAMALQSVCHDMATNYVLKILGLEVCADTLVGDEMRRGISGGQKKRTTIGEIIVGPARVYFMDEITSGLDSATAFQIITCLGQFAHQLEMTLLIALLQPAPEVFDLFDDVILLAEGQVVYHGPCDEVLPFFESCGFRCPPRKGIADFLQEVTSRKDQEQYWSDKTKRYKYLTVHSFNTLFRKSPTGMKLYAELETPFDKAKSNKAALVHKEWSLPQLELFKITFRKELLFLKRNSFLYVFKTIQMMIQGLILMSLFFRTEMHRKTLKDAGMFNAALFTGANTVMFTGYAECMLTITRLPHFFKQRDMKFIPGWALALSTFLTRLPFSITESTVFLAITYYPIGFAPAGGRFLKNLMILIVSHQMASSLFRLIAGVCGTLILANSFGAMILLCVYALGGFVVVRSRFKPWWLWGYWTSPLSWTVTAINEVEFLSPQWNERFIEGTNTTLGKRELHLSGLYPHGYWYWASFGVLFFYIVLFNLLFMVGLTYTKAPGRPRPVVSAEVLGEWKANRTADQTSETITRTPSTHVSTPAPEHVGIETEFQRRPSDSVSGSDFPSEIEGLTKRPSGIELSRVTSKVSGSSRDRSSLELMREVAGLAPKHGMVLPFRPLSISFNNVNYFVDMPKEMRARGATEDKLQLLRSITGAFRPGILTALVGVTGAGKSTLMDVLLGRKTRGIVEGDIRISGFPKIQRTFARVSGYCEQNDIHTPQLTVYESVILSAWLRLSPEIHDDTKRQFADEVMELVELATLRNSIVGIGTRSGLSIEQRKRLTIAVELVANPSIIFMDEPTSGLDARAAAIVMRAVRNTVDTGRTVVCTIHQPSIDIFESFDELVLLKEGGQCIYAGPLGRDSNKLIEYFEEIPGIPKIRDGYNPATWMLEITTRGMERKLGVDFAEIYENSAQYRRTKALVEELSHPPPGTEDLIFPSEYSRSYVQQLYTLWWKGNLIYWRCPDYNMVRFGFTVFVAIFFGTLFLHTGQKRSSQFGISQVLGSIFVAGLMMGTIGSITVQPVISVERAVSYRERAAGMYSTIPFCVAQLLVEIPYTLLQSVIYALITYALINLEWKADKVFLYFYFTFINIQMYIYYGMMMVALTPNLELATIVTAFFFNIWNFFGGFLIPKPQLPVWWAWYYWACPMSWSIYGSIVAQFGDLTDKFIPVIGYEEKMSIPHFIKITYGFRHEWLGYTIGMSALFVFLFGVVYVVCIRFLNFQQR